MTTPTAPALRAAEVISEAHGLLTGAGLLARNATLIDDATNLPAILSALEGLLDYLVGISAARPPVVKKAFAVLALARKEP